MKIGFEVLSSSIVAYPCVIRRLREMFTVYYCSYRLLHLNNFCRLGIYR